MRQAFSEPDGSPRLRWEFAAFAGALLVYAITRFYRLADYPIYFFCDEAFQPLSAEHLLRNGFRNAKGQLFPFYFWNDAWAPLLPVWAHVVSVKLFGRSVEVARATCAAFTLLGAAAVGLTLKYGFRSRLWWSGPLFLATTPIFFQRSRTTFETAFAASFFACFILFYILYRCRSPRFLYPAILFGACSFYSYTQSQVVTAVSAVFLGIVDIRYHVRHWRQVVPGLVLLAVVMLPLYRFRHDEPAAARDGLKRVDSYWVAKVPLREKIRQAALQYGLALSPKYWFFPNYVESSRHTMDGYGHIRTAMLPLFAVGVAVCLWKIRSPAHRTIVICALTSASGGALTLVNAVRLLSFVVPAIIIVLIGASALFELVRPVRVRNAVGAALFAILAGSSLHLLADALTNGPRWSHDYGLYGQQWGAKQIFEVIAAYLKADPDNRVGLTSSWANGAHLFVPFFLTEGSSEASRVFGGGWQMASSGRAARSPKTMFVMTREETDDARASGHFSSIQVDRVLNYPDGRPGFFFVRLEVSPHIGEILARDREKLRELIEGQVVVHGETLSVRHYRLDMGNLGYIFDGDPETLGRFNAANPTVMEIRFPRPRAVRKVIFDLWGASFAVDLRLSSAEEGESQRYAVVHPEEAPHRFEIPIARGPAETALVRVEIRNVNVGEGEPSIVHLHGLEFR